MKTPRACLAILGAGLLVVACTSNVAPSVTPGPSDTPSASPSATATVDPAATPTPVVTFPPTLPPPSSAPPTASPSPSPSDEPSPTITPSPTPAVSEIVRFRREQHVEPQRNLVDCTRADFDGTIHLAWRLRNVTGATLAIDGPGIFDSYSGTTGEVDVPFACGPLEHTYTLTTTGGPEPPASITRTIRVAQPDIIDMAVIGPNCPNPSDVVPMSVTWQIAYATGIELWVNGELFATYSGKQSPAEGSNAGTYDCSQASAEYRIVTTGGYGTPDAVTLTAVP